MDKNSILKVLTVVALARLLCDWLNQPLIILALILSVPCSLFGDDTATDSFISVLTYTDQVFSVARYIVTMKVASRI